MKKEITLLEFYEEQKKINERVQLALEKVAQMFLVIKEDFYDEEDASGESD